MSPNEEAEVLRALNALEIKFTASLNTGLASVNASIASLTEMHHQAMLEQERRNAQFATRDRLDSLAEVVHAHGNQLARKNLRLTNLETCVDKLETQLEHLSESEANRSFGLLSGAAGYLVTALLMTMSALLTFLLTHAVH